MGRIGSGWVVIMAALVMTASGCSDEPGAQGGSPAASTPSPAPIPASASTQKPESKPEPVADTRSQAELIEAGRGTYNANCIACHSMNPAQDGALGPAVAGASPELIEARVMRGAYPPGYAPKRETKVMIPLPHLEAKLPELAAYLGSLK